MNRNTKREVVATLVKAGRRDLAVSFSYDTRRDVMVAGIEESDKAWETISAAWKKNHAAFLKVLDVQEKTAMSNNAMQSDYKKAFKKIRMALKTISTTISDNADAV